ncbi:carbonic anhydrase 4 [Mantella aurantiaca]
MSGGQVGPKVYWAIPGEEEGYKFIPTMQILRALFLKLHEKTNIKDIHKPTVTRFRQVKMWLTAQEFLFRSPEGSWCYEILQASGINCIGPREWTTIGSCNKKEQSPINIITKKTEFKDLKQFTFSGYDAEHDAELKNNGHSAQLNLNTQAEITISGGGLEGTYKASQLHFHWGSSNMLGSEHSIDGERYAAELHIVHNSKSSGRAESGGETTANGRNIAVLGFFIEETTDDNSKYSSIIEALNNIRTNGNSTTVSKVKLQDLIPEKNLEYFYRYDGSLTTPDCNETVIWTVFPETIKLGENQLEKFYTKLNYSAHAFMAENFRPVQKMGDRKVYTSGVEAVLSHSRHLFISFIDEYENKKNLEKGDKTSHGQAIGSDIPTSAASCQVASSDEDREKDDEASDRTWVPDRTEKERPRQWATINSCDGHKQSPINIVSKQAKVLKDLKSFKFNGYDAEHRFILTNNGHSVELSLEEEKEITISEGGLGEKYIVKQLHFHWGNIGVPGSEHSLDGERYAAEVHIVHTNVKSKRQSRGDTTGEERIAVLGFFIKESEENNKKYEGIIQALNNIRSKEKTTSVKVKLQELIPEDLKIFYRYNGSLTTPGCDEIVIWTVFNETIHLGKSQLEAFYTKLNYSADTVMVENFRPLQKLGNRTVYKSGVEAVLCNSKYLLLSFIVVYRVLML